MRPEPDEGYHEGREQNNMKVVGQESSILRASPERGWPSNLAMGQTLTQEEHHPIFMSSVSLVTSPLTYKCSAEREERNNSDNSILFCKVYAQSEGEMDPRRPSLHELIPSTHTQPARTRVPSPRLFSTKNNLKTLTKEPECMTLNFYNFSQYFTLVT